MMERQFGNLIREWGEENSKSWGRRRRVDTVVRSVDEDAFPGLRSTSRVENFYRGLSLLQNMIHYNLQLRLLPFVQPTPELSVAAYLSFWVSTSSWFSLYSFGLSNPIVFCSILSHQSRAQYPRSLRNEVGKNRRKKIKRRKGRNVPQEAERYGAAEGVRKIVGAVNRGNLKKNTENIGTKQVLRANGESGKGKQR